MKRILSCVLALMLALTCLFAVSCGEKEAEITRSFIAGYEKTVAMGETETQMSGRVLMNLKDDGTLDLYVGFVGMGSHETAHYTGTYTLGENAEYDETISFTYTYAEGKTETVTDAVIIDGIFETPFYMISSMTSNGIKFYESAVAETDGDVYVGYMTKTGGMGAMVYAYALNMKDDATFDISIMQMAGGIMHVWGGTNGTYVKDGDKVTFTYDVKSTEGEIVTAGYTSEGTILSETEISVGFNISQTTVRASSATFIKVK